MKYKHGKWSSGATYRYARGVSREYQCPQCHAEWLQYTLTVCYDCREKNITQEQNRILAQEKKN